MGRLIVKEILKGINSSGRRKVVLDGMLEMQEGMKHNRKIQYPGKSK